MLHNLVDNRDSKREEKAISDKKSQKKAKVRAFLEERSDQKDGKVRSAYRRQKRDWLDQYDDEEIEFE